MPIRVNDLYHTDVLTPAGKRIGRVGDVLFDAEKPAVIGYVVERSRLLYILDRRDRFLAADRARARRDAVSITDLGGAFDVAAAKRLGIDWETTVIWSGMRVSSPGGAELGTVKDVVFEDDGSVCSLHISGGATADIAVGIRQVPGPSVLGYRDGVVQVTVSAESTETSGGAAAAAGKGAAIAGEQARQTAVAAGKAIKSATEYGKAAAKVAVKSKTGKKTIGWLRSVRDEIVDAMGDPDDE